MSKPKIIILRTGNSAFSQLVKELLRALAGEQFEVFSAGTGQRDRTMPKTQEVMREVGIDISSRWSKSVMEYLGKDNFGYVIDVSEDAEEDCPEVFLNKGTHGRWSYDEEQHFISTQRVREQIEKRMRLWLIEG